ncbi:MAG: hypothetical protein WEC16_01145 [Anaerolineales bacterium]
MLDVLSEIVSAIANVLFGTWWNDPSQLTRTLIWILAITIIAGLVLLFFPWLADLAANL